MTDHAAFCNMSEDHFGECGILSGGRMRSDMAGNQIALDKLVRQEPEWAVSHIRKLEKQLADIGVEIKKGFKVMGMDVVIDNTVEPHTIEIRGKDGLSKTVHVGELSDLQPVATCSEEGCTTAGPPTEEKDWKCYKHKPIPTLTEAVARKFIQGMQVTAIAGNYDGGDVRALAALLTETQNPCVVVDCETPAHTYCQRHVMAEIRKARAEVVINGLKALDSRERACFFEAIGTEFCFHCGGTDGYQCQCENDD